MGQTCMAKLLKTKELCAIKIENLVDKVRTTEMFYDSNFYSKHLSNLFYYLLSEMFCIYFFHSKHLSNFSLYNLLFYICPLSYLYLYLVGV